MSAACEPVTQVCLLQYDTAQSRVHNLKHVRPSVTYAVQGLSYYVKVEQHKKSKHNPVPSKDFEVMLLDITH